MSQRFVVNAGVGSWSDSSPVRLAIALLGLVAVGCGGASRPTEENLERTQGSLISSLTVTLTRIYIGDNPAPASPSAPLFYNADVNFGAFGGSGLPIWQCPQLNGLTNWLSPAEDPEAQAIDPEGRCLRPSTQTGKASIGKILANDHAVFQLFPIPQGVSQIPVTVSFVESTNSSHNFDWFFTVNAITGAVTQAQTQGNAIAKTSGINNEHSCAEGPEHWRICWKVQTAGACIPTPEILDGADNDCDGLVDECDPPQVAWPCTATINMPQCPAATPGLASCNPQGGPVGACVAVGNGQPESFNGLDDNCTGVVDECSPPQVSWSCTATINATPPCPSTVPGLASCNAQGATPCVAIGNGQPESLNGKDDNCNGEIDDVPSLPWTPIGPAPLSNTITFGANGEIASGASGRSTVIAVNPVNHRELWLGTAGGGLWHTTDVLVPEPQWNVELDGPIGAVALDNCGTGACRVWVGTGENVIRRHSYGGYGIYLGTPNGTGGRSYAVVGDSDVRFKNATVYKLIPEPGDLLYAAVSLGMSTTQHVATIWAPRPPGGYGIHKFANGVWTQIADHSGNPLSGNGDLTGLPTDLERDPVNAGRYIAGFMGQGLFRSQPGNEQTWCALDASGAALSPGCPTPPSDTLPNVGTFDHVELAVVPGSPTMVATFSNCPAGSAADFQGVTVDSCPHVIYRSLDGGTTWQPFTSLSVDSKGGTAPVFGLPGPSRQVNDIAGLFGTYSRYSHTLNLLPDGRFLFGGLMLYQLNATGPLGAVAAHVGLDTLHPDHHDVVLFPGEGDSGQDLIYSSNDGGLYISTDGGGTFKSANVNLVSMQFYGIGVDEIDENLTDTVPTDDAVCGGLQDNGLALFKGSRVWQFFGGGDGGNCKIQSRNGERVYTNHADVTVERTGLPALNLVSFTESLARRSFEPVLFEHTLTRNIFFADNRVFVIQPADRMSPVQIAPILDATTNVTYPAVERSWNIITALAAAPSDVNRVYVGFYDGTIFSSAPGASIITGACNSATSACWQKITSPKAAPVAAFAIHPTQPDTFWVAFNSFAGPNVWKTTDRGMTWSPRAGNLPSDLPVSFIRADPRDVSGSALYLGTATGLMHTSNGGTTWLPLGAPGSFPRVPVFDVAIDAQRNRIFASTHGRGVYMLAGTPTVYTFASCSNSQRQNIEIYGAGFTCPAGATCPCTVELLSSTGAVCAGPAGVDAAQGNIVVRDGFLTTDRANLWQNQGVVRGCQGGQCLGGVSAANCQAASVRVSCNSNPPVTGQTPTCVMAPAAPPVPSALMLAPLPATTPGASAKQFSTAFSLDVVPAIVASPTQGGDRALCAARVSVAAGDSLRAVRDKLITALNTEPECARFGIVADGADLDAPEVEDDAQDYRVRVQGGTAAANGVELAVGYRLNAGGPGACVRTSDLDLYRANRIGARELAFDTGPAIGGGAKGGWVEVIESSPLGLCRQVVPTTAGQSASAIAAAVATAFQAPGLPGPRNCPARQNPRDVVQQGSSVSFRQATSVVICVNDVGVAVSYGPTGVKIAPPAVKLRELGILGLDGATVRDGAFVTDGTGRAPIGAGGGLGAVLLAGAQTGDVFSVGNVELKTGARVAGRVKTAGALIRASQTTVDGAIVEHATVQLPTLNGFLSPVPSGADQIVSSGTVALNPGAYGNLIVKNGAQLRLRAGIYTMTSLVMETGSRLLFDEGTGPVKLYVGTTLIWRGTLQTVSGAHPSGFVAYQGAADTFLETAFRGTVAAPFAKLVLRAVSGGHTGAFFGRYVEVDTQARVELEPFVLAPPCTDGLVNNSETDADCGGTCGATCRTGQSCAVAADCATGVCTAGTCQSLPACTESSAIDMGAPGANVTVPRNGCLRVRDGYPSNWGTRNMQLQSASPGSFPVPYIWSSSCTGAGGSGLFTGPSQSQIIGPTSKACATLIDLQGASTGTVTIRYFAN